MEAVLIYKGHTFLRRQELNGLEVIVGREGDIVLDDPTLAARHAALRKKDDRWWVTDLGAGAGVLKVNLDPIARGATERLRDGDRLDLGSYSLRCLVASPLPGDVGPASLPAQLAEAPEAAIDIRAVPTQKVEASPSARAPAAKAKRPAPPGIEGAGAAPAARTPRRPAPPLGVGQPAVVQTAPAAASAAATATAAKAEAAMAPPPPVAKRVVRPVGSIPITTTIKTFSDAEGAVGVLDTLRLVHEAQVRLVIATADLRIVVPIEATDVTIGQAEECDIAINHPTVSPRHASIRFIPGDNVFALDDLHSAHHTFVNGARMEPGQPVLLAPHTAITFGAVPCLFTFAAAAFPNRAVAPAPDADIIRDLVQRHVLSPAQADEVVAEAARQQASLGVVLVHRGLLEPEAWARIHRKHAFAPSRGGSRFPLTRRAALGLIGLVALCALLYWWALSG